MVRHNGRLRHVEGEVPGRTLPNVAAWIALRGQSGMVAFFEEPGDLAGDGHGGSGTRLHDGQRSDGIGIVRGLKHVVLELDEPGGKSTDKRIARPGGVHDLNVVRIDARVNIGLRDKAAMGAEGDDDHGHLEAAAEPVQRVGLEHGQRGFGESARRVERGGAQQGGASRPQLHQGDEFGLIGNEHLGVPEEGGVKTGAHGRGVEHGDRAMAAGGAQHSGHGAVVGLTLAHDHLGGLEQRSRDVTRAQTEVGAGRHDDLVLPGAVDAHHGGPGGIFGFFDKVGMYTRFAGELPGAGAEHIWSDGTDKKGGDARPRSSDRLVETLATGARAEIANDRLPRPGKIPGVEREILAETADDDDRVFHDMDRLEQGCAGWRLFSGRPVQNFSPGPLRNSATSGRNTRQSRVWAGQPFITNRIKTIPESKATSCRTVHPAPGPFINFALSMHVFCLTLVSMSGERASAFPLLRPAAGLAGGQAGMFHRAMTMNPALETAAKLQRAKERLYVLCQLGGWGGFTALQLVFYNISGGRSTGQKTDPLFEQSVLCMVMLMGLLLTHGIRPLIRRWDWKRLGWAALLPRVAGMSFLMSILWTVAGYGYIYLVLRCAWTSRFGPVFALSASIINGALMFVGWFCVYFAYHAFERLQRMQVEQLRLAANVKEAELRALKSQVNPHFLFNSLNSLRALIDEDAPKAREAVTRLANMLRYSLQSGQLETVSLDEELRTVEDYLALEQIRHEGRLRVRWAVAEAARTQSVPPMLLQTMVENAVKYGISTRREGGEVLVSARIENGTLCLLVTNPGELAAPGNAASAKAGSSTGVGLRNASERLKLLYGDQATLRLLAEPAGCVTAEVSIPLQSDPA